MKEELGDCNVYAFSCEGYKGVSQSAGHHIANNQVFKHVVGEDDTPRGKWSINLLGEALRPLEIFKWIIIPLLLILVMIFRPTGLVAFREFDAAALILPKRPAARGD